MVKQEKAREKKAQVTIFVIIAIFIVVATVSFLIYKNYLNAEKLEKIKKDYGNIEYNVENCLKEKTLDGVKYLADQGGSLNESNTFYGLHYFYYQGENVMPSHNEISFYLSQYIENNIPECLNELDLSKLGANITSKPKINVVFSENKVHAEMSLPIKISRGDIQQEISEFDADVQHNFIFLYNSAEEIVKQQVQDPENLCVKCWQDMTKKHRIKINLVFLNRNIIFTLTKNKDVLSFVSGY